MQDRPQSSQSNTGVDLSRSSAYDHAKQFTSEIPSKSYSSSDGESRCYLFLLCKSIRVSTNSKHIYNFTNFHTEQHYRIQENPVHNLRGASGNTKEENLIVS
jgi:hypothetical protein